MFHVEAMYCISLARRLASAMALLCTLLAACAFANEPPDRDPEANTAARPDNPPVDPSAADFFESKIRPLLLAHCVECHGAAKQESGLRLDSRENVLKGNDEGPVVLLKKPETSRLLRAVRHEGDIKM